MQSHSNDVGVIGAGSLVGCALLPLLSQAGYKVTAVLRSRSDETAKTEPQTPEETQRTCCSEEQISLWICLAPIWVLPDYFDYLSSHGVRRLVALSSTSCVSKSDSDDPDERDLASRIGKAELDVQAWARKESVEYLILRSTLIYGFQRDKNVTMIAAFIRRYRFFPMIAPGAGLRQPIHALDVAKICKAALENRHVTHRTYTISGGESLTYCAMVARVFLALGLEPRIIFLPRWVLKCAIAFVRRCPRFRHWSMAMVDRMNTDLDFGHEDAARDLGFSPTPFLPRDGEL